MIVAVTLMGMMEVFTNEIVNVVPVRHAFMSTSGTVSVPAIMAFAIMIRCARTRVDVAYGKRMFVDVVFMYMMQVPIVQIVGVAIVGYGCMPTLGVVGVTVGGMLFTHCFHGTDLRCNQTRPVFEDISSVAQLHIRKNTSRSLSQS
jgi:hypothetical protein